MRSCPHNLFLAAAVFLSAVVNSQSSFDSLNLKLPKHYFQTAINVDLYRRGSTRFADTTHRISRKLKSYAVKQFFLNFYTPLTTKSWVGKDSAYKNTHLLLTGNYLSLQPVFDGIPDHTLVKMGLGVRYIFNSGKKGVWFAEVSPFITADVTYPSKPYFRMANTFIYSHNTTEKFNWRLGITKSFLWGNRFYLPFVGLRIGALDQVHFSLQFPRSASFVVPMGSKVVFSVYSRPQGGMFNFSNADSLYRIPGTETVHFTRREVVTGGRFDIRVGDHFNFYLATGFSSGNNITFYSEEANRNRKAKNYDTYFYSKDVADALCLDFGLTFRFGRSRSSYNVKNIMDAGDLNNVLQDINNNSQIIIPPRQKSRLNLESVQDLIDYTEY